MRVLVVTSLLLFAAGARAAEVTRVVSALDDENRFDFNLTLAWLHETRSSFIKSESEGDPGLPSVNGNIPLAKDLQYFQRRDILDMRMDFGILWDVGLHVGLPLVLADERTLAFDQSAGSGCVFPGGPTSAPVTCVNSQNSRFLEDGILPGYQTNTYGLNANNGMPYTAPSSSVFRGPTRKGFESLNLGLTWAAFNQRRDDTRPTWTLSFDTKLDIFKDMRFDSANPGANTAVGLGYHQFIWSTFVSKRFRYFEPYFGAWYMLPVRTNHSIYADARNGTVNPQQMAAVVAGVEQIAWENPRASQRVTVELRGRAMQNFFGRSASEIWEPLMGSQPCLTMEIGCRPGVDNSLNPNFHSHPGVTETQAYASFGGDAGLNVQVGQYVRFRGLFGLLFNQSHFITYASPGGKAGVELTPAQANTNYRDALDAPGRRFKVENSHIMSLYLEGSLMF